MLPTRDGIGPSVVGLPVGPWARVIDFLSERFPGVPVPEWVQRMQRGEVVDSRGLSVWPDQLYEPQAMGQRLYYYRSLPSEAPNSAAERVLFEDETIVVADKPHFLPVTPGGKHLQETLLVRLRRRLGCDTLTPLHRLDRETAGLVLLARHPESRAAYEALFAQRQVTKTYQAIARWDPQLQFPLRRVSTLVDADHFMQMREAGADDTPQLPNAHTTIELLEIQGSWARYALQPQTGKRHQLRVHMAALGIPILGDRIYPQLLPEGTDDPGNPLRLLAERLQFTDPITGQARDFVSQFTLDFPDPLSFS